MKLITGVVCLWAGAVSAAIPELEEGVYLQSGNGPLTVGYYTTPSVIDWNKDGKKDLLVGQFTSGYCWLFLNQGTDAKPVFGPGQKILSSGVAITTSYG